MTSRMPPVPKANRSSKGPGGSAKADPAAAKAPGVTDPEKQGQQANTKINTTNQGHQQDQ
ncbi:MAG: hypothetical protein V7668_07770 [Cereibacter changlensis]|jgi:hypothetical protein|uniref:Uncharacterized protein n=1 Tax=Cereibacter changlensis TaxID=402884 RepID=A0A4U0Z2H5_9RHOB|nr:hypothetical protein [Cereibacter changlensis]MBZ4690454.1 hypothetical protein [Cereibacter sp.]TKA97336.1 hypothetical protein FAZ78_06600 [Cereibacter changlensis]